MTSENKKEEALQLKRGALPLDALSVPKKIIAKAVLCAALPEESNDESLFFQKISQTMEPNHDALQLPCGQFCPKFAKPMAETSRLLQDCLEKYLKSGDNDNVVIKQYHEYVDRFEYKAGHLLFYLKPLFFGQVVQAVVQHQLLHSLEQHNPQPERIMVEYGGVNTHKVFHVGHMRNAALGDSLVRLLKHCGHDVTAANYYGDEGAHVAKCLWLLKKQQDSLDSIPTQERGEFLGKIYSKAAEMLKLSSLTSLPYRGVVAAQVANVTEHPAMNDWSVVELECGETHDSNTDTAVVVVTSASLLTIKTGDMVAYVPVGETFGKEVIESETIGGVSSAGKILTYNDLGMNPSPKVLAAVTNGLSEADKSANNTKKQKKARDVAKGLVHVLDASLGATAGVSLVELGRLPGALPENQGVLEVFDQRTAEANDVLVRLEQGDKEWVDLWQLTRQWSLDEFKAIYDWAGAHFDHDFCESLVSEESKQIVMDRLKQGDVFQERNGAIGVDLEEYGMPFLYLIKSDGAGLYATKELALAARKFEEFHIERSIYVVDATQSLHFQQVFKTLELMKFENAKNCFHLSYGLVIRPDGKMSSRKGTVIYFSSLKQQLYDQIMQEFLGQFQGTWSDDEIKETCHKISVGTIRYGMLQVDASKVITFSLESWTAKTGDTGPYLMYAYARMVSIQKTVPMPAGFGVEDFDPSLLSGQRERSMILHLSQFWPIVQRAANTYKPHLLCRFLFVLAQNFQSWYSQPENSVKEAATDELRCSRLVFIKAVMETLKTGLQLLGIEPVDRM